MNQGNRYLALVLVDNLFALSLIILATLEGARVLYLDYERLDYGPLKQYTFLHPLGHKRWVFYDPESF
jgi:hypothetical protein